MSLFDTLTAAAAQTSEISDPVRETEYADAYDRLKLLYDYAIKTLSERALTAWDDLFIAEHAKYRQDATVRFLFETAHHLNERLTQQYSDLCHARFGFFATKFPLHEALGTHVPSHERYAPRVRLTAFPPKLSFAIIERALRSAFGNGASLSDMRRAHMAAILTQKAWHVQKGAPVLHFAPFFKIDQYERKSGWSLWLDRGDYQILVDALSLHETGVPFKKFSPSSSPDVQYSFQGAYDDRYRCDRADGQFHPVPEEWRRIDSLAVFPNGDVKVKFTDHRFAYEFAEKWIQYTN